MKPIQWAAYSYLLGLYLGDGCISRSGRVWRLRVVLDNAYPNIIEECTNAMQTLLPHKKAYRLARKGCLEVSMYSKHWPCFFPQHGPGPKHLRQITLASWQETILIQHPRELLRGLIHSDGCRNVANDRGRLSPRYQFSNRSADIHKIFCDALHQLNIPWTRPTSHTVAVYRKAAVGQLDEFIGPKT